jgi:hypothetical protein
VCEPADRKTVAAAAPPPPPPVTHLDQHGLVGQEHDVHEAGPVRADEHVRAPQQFQLLAEGERPEVDDVVVDEGTRLEHIFQGGFVGEHAARVLRGGAAADREHHLRRGRERRVLVQVEGPQDVHAEGVPQRRLAAPLHAVLPAHAREDDPGRALEVEHGFVEAHHAAAVVGGALEGPLGREGALDELQVRPVGVPVEQDPLHRVPRHPQHGAHREGVEVVGAAVEHILAVLVAGHEVRRRRLHLERARLGRRRVVHERRHHLAQVGLKFAAVPRLGLGARREHRASVEGVVPERGRGERASVGVV